MVPAVLRVWLLFSPFVLKYREWPTVAGNSWAVGIVVIGIALAEARALAHGPHTVA